LTFFCRADDGEAPFPRWATTMLTAQERNSLLLVVARGLQFYLLFEPAERLQAFMDAMSTLCMAAHAAVDHAEDNQQPVVSTNFFMRSIGVRALRPHLTNNAGLLQPHLTKRGMVVQYLAAYGYKPQSEVVWHILECGESRPKLAIHVRQHIEAAKHTWYIIESSLVLDSKDPKRRLDWIAPRRLAHLRKHLHLPVREAFREKYGTHFAGAAFALRLGPPGTTERLRKWFCTLANCINSKQAPPLVAALTLRFLEAPQEAREN